MLKPLIRFFFGSSFMMKLEKGTFSVIPINMLKGLSPLIQVVFIWLCHHANEDGICWPSLETLCEECSASHASITKATKELVRIGYLEKDRRRNSSCKYQIIIKNKEELKLGMQESSNAKILQCKNLASGMQESSIPECKNLASNYNHRTKLKELKPSLCAFDKFWSIYPHHKDRAKAFKSFEKINPDENLLKKILDAIELQKQEKELMRKQGQFIPEWKYPTTWLNGKCWEDEVNLTTSLENDDAIIRQKPTTRAQQSHDIFWDSVKPTIDKIFK